MATEIITSFLQLSDSAGSPMSGAKVYVYDVGTTTLRTIYSDPSLGGGFTAANPIICDSVGRHAMRYTATGSYKIVVKTSADVSVYTSDNIDGRIPIGSGALAVANGGTGATTAGSALSNLGAATSAEVAVIAAQLATLAGTLTSVEKTHIATGTTAQRPVSPLEGDIRRNTSTSLYEAYTTDWINFATYSTASSRPTVQRFTSGSGTYTTPTGCLWIRVRMVAGGGGGGAVATNAGTNGGDTNFGSWTAVHGNGGAAAAGDGGVGGTGGVNSTGTLVNRIIGQKGAPGTSGLGTGGSTCFGGGGPAAASGNPGSAAVANTGSGGSAGSNAGVFGGGGGAGEFVEFFITAPTTTYSYAVGAAGAGGAAGTQAGGNGAAGIIFVEEYYIG